MSSPSESQMGLGHETVHVFIGGVQAHNPEWVSLGDGKADVVRLAGERQEGRRLLEIVATSKQVIFWPWINEEN